MSKKGIVTIKNNKKVIILLCFSLSSKPEVAGCDSIVVNTIKKYTIFMYTLE
ncbi:hypothetical protein RU95_GL002365 [Enterococcus avium]|nr:hypothetical protein RU95_GL002365 [Enterococcus avium]